MSKSRIERLLTVFVEYLGDDCNAGEKDPNEAILKYAGPNDLPCLSSNPRPLWASVH